MPRVEWLAGLSPRTKELPHATDVYLDVGAAKLKTKVGTPSIGARTAPFSDAGATAARLKLIGYINQTQHRCPPAAGGRRTGTVSFQQNTL